VEAPTTPPSVLAEAAPSPRWPPPPSGATSDFCIETVDALDDSSCYVLPDAPTDELLLYLHGIVPPTKTSRQKTNFETVVSTAARRAGVAALMPRGRQGLAPKGHDGWWGWPTSAAAYARWADELTAEFAQKRGKLEALSGRRFERLYVAGSSSGAYFVAALALRGAIAADGFAAISGGALAPGADFHGRAPKPFYIGYGTADTVGPGAQALAARLRALGFPVKLSAHPLPHGAAEVYLDEAFAHFRAHPP
jgi:predicted esterase